MEDMCSIMSSITGQTLNLKTLNPPCMHACSCVRACARVCVCARVGALCTQDRGGGNA